MSGRRIDPAVDRLGSAERPADEGTILVMVLVMMVIGALIVLPVLVYTMTVFRAGTVQTNKAEAVELARGGTWVALSNQESLYDLCGVASVPPAPPSPPVALPQSLSNVSTTCQVVQTETLRPVAEIPFHLALVQSDVTVPAQIADPINDYPSPNSTAIDPADFDAWLDAPDWSSDPLAGKVWVPQLPVQATSTGTRDTTMIPGYEDPLYAGQTCRVFFPGTFNAQIDIDTPTYFTSGVYYFTQPIVLHNGADVVVGNGGAGGCTTDFEAIASAVAVPDPLNMSGYGGTFVLGDDARIIVDDSTPADGDIRFAMNQRIVSPDETSVAASLNVSIVSVNGTHEPLSGPEVLGDDLIVPGVIHVPASTVDTGDPVPPRAVDSGYTPSNLTAKSFKPDPPTIVSVDDYQRPGFPPARGRLTVRWNAPADNGSPITGYTATDVNTGLSCSPMAPTLPDTSVQTSCIIKGIEHSSGQHPTVVVTATNALGTSDPSAPVDGQRVDLVGGTQSPIMWPPDAPLNPTITDVYLDGIRVDWDPPADDNGGPVTGYRVTATPTVPGPPIVSCEAWWDETDCILRASDGLVGDGTVAYVIDVVALQHEEPPAADYPSAPAVIAALPIIFDPGADPAPFQVPVVIAGIRVPDPILQFTTSGSTSTDISIEGYVAVPQGRIEIDVVDPVSTEVSMLGGIVAGQMTIGPSVDPGRLDIRLDNPVAQKRVRIISTTSGAHRAVSDAVVQVNRSGSIAINSWVVQ